MIFKIKDKLLIKEIEHIHVYQLKSEKLDNV